ncbi:uncharacterized protein EI90DRAFT_3041918 [Cantharellus anzutake]|uniref:uncharacterized protein n=1 Tax=Cantharellus anzutake TaxID=1750568 RepID=UPI001906B7D3|nr:uncharacterized protein EI90DRAFT_3041918 [Cantharellus anzutake]KAF8338165.1 hypothetical protein EI90DRAFT_3041918 [Cantharellus anzutake]
MDEEDDGLLGISGNPLTPRITSQIIRYLLQRGGGRTWYLEPGGATDPDDECEEERPTAVGSRRWFPQVTVPSKVGQRLLAGGEFGRLGPYLRSRESSNASLAKRVRDMRTSPGRFVREDLSRDLIPNTSGTIAARYEANPYCGQYSSDSSFYYTCVQDFRLHIYDATHPPSLAVSGDQSEDETTMKETKTINAVPGNWTITDSHLSPDNERMIYSSITTTVHMTRTRDSSNEQIPIPLADEFRRGVRGYVPDFGIYSCRFSADGNEIIAGGSGSIFDEIELNEIGNAVYDLQGMRRTVRISAHKEDVNSCCWADTASGNVLISASDDTFLKVWWVGRFTGPLRGSIGLI